jgi:hypothetical protein
VTTDQTYSPPSPSAFVDRIGILLLILGMFPQLQECISIATRHNTPFVSAFCPLYEIALATHILTLIVFAHQSAQPPPRLIFVAWGLTIGLCASVYTDMAIEILCMHHLYTSSLAPGQTSIFPVWSLDPSFLFVLSQSLKYGLWMTTPILCWAISFRRNFNARKALWLQAIWLAFTALPSAALMIFDAECLRRIDLGFFKLSPFIALTASLLILFHTRKRHRRLLALSINPLLCSACDYNLTGITAPTCPECGAPLPTAPPR